MELQTVNQATVSSLRSMFHSRNVLGVVIIVCFLVNIIAALRNVAKQIKSLLGPAEQQIEKSQLCSHTKAKPVAQGDPFVRDFLRQLSVGSLPVAARLVLDMRSSGLAPAPCFYRLLFQHMARLRAPRDLFNRVAEDLHGRSCLKDSLTECYHVQYLSRTGDVHNALAAFEELVKGGFQPDLRTFECLMVACLRTNGLHDSVRRLFDELDMLNLQPTPVMYSVLITSYGQNGAVSSGLAALEQMKIDYVDDSKALRLGYTSAIHAAARNHRMGKVSFLLDDYMQQGLPMDARLVGILLATAVQTGSKEFAERVVAHAKEERVEGLEAMTSRLLGPLEKRPGSAAMLANVHAGLGTSAPA